MMLICPGCGKEFNPLPKAGSYRGGRYRKYCSDACRKRVARASLLTPISTDLAKAADPAPALPRKRTESGQKAQRFEFWVFDWQAEYFGPLSERDAVRLQSLLQGQLFQAPDFFQASAAYRRFLFSEAGRLWLDQQPKPKPKPKSS